MKLKFLFSLSHSHPPCSACCLNLSLKMLSCGVRVALLARDVLSLSLSTDVGQRQKHFIQFHSDSSSYSTPPPPTVDTTRCSTCFHEKTFAIPAISHHEVSTLAEPAETSQTRTRLSASSDISASHCAATYIISWRSLCCFFLERVGDWKRKKHLSSTHLFGCTTKERHGGHERSFKWIFSFAFGILGKLFFLFSFQFARVSVLSLMQRKLWILTRPPPICTFNIRTGRKFMCGFHIFFNAR